MNLLSCALMVATNLSLWSYAVGQAKPCEALKIPPRPIPRNMGVLTRPPFHVEVERDRKDGTRFILTNWYRVPLTAYVEEITPVPNGKEGGVEHRFHTVDALVGDGELLWPIPENLNTIHYVTHNVGRPDAQPSIAAAVWEDGLTYGPKELVQKVMARRQLSAVYRQHAIDLLQAGLKEAWDANHWVAEGRSREDGLRVMTVDPELNLIVEFDLAVAVDNLMRVQRESPDAVGRVAKMVLDHELKEKEALDAGLRTMENPLPSAPLMCAQ